MSGALPPSGEQVEIGDGDAAVTVVAVGGGLRRYEAGGRPVLDGYPESALCDGGRGQNLMPWPNRLADGRYTWDGSAYQVPISQPSTATAIHGLVRWATWTVTRAGPAEAEARLRLAAQPGYPFTLDLTVSYRLGPGGLTVTTTATNRSSAACPFGAGVHPYLAPAGGERVDDAVLVVPADVVLETDERSLPSGRRQVGGTDLDFRSGRRIGGEVLDHAFTGLLRDDDGLVRVRLADADGGGAVTLWADESYPWLQVFTGDTLAPDRRRAGLAVEPMTCPANALATGEDVVRLEPGVTWTGRWGITPG